MFSISKYNKNGLIKIILFVMSLGDYLLTYKSESNLVLSIAIILISPQENKSLFSTFTLMAFFEFEEGVHLASPLLLLLVFGYYVLTSGFILVGQEILKENYSIGYKFNATNSSGKNVKQELMYATVGLTKSDKMLVVDTNKVYKHHKLVRFILLGFTILHIILQLVGAFIRTKENGKIHNPLQGIISLTRNGYFITAYFWSWVLLLRFFNKNTTQQIKNY
jgi:hypothetical protein